MPYSQGAYYGWQAVEHCKREVNRWKNAGHTVLSFFIKSSYDSTTPSQFSEMYGKESARDIDVTNIIKLARELNKTWAIKA